MMYLANPCTPSVVDSMRAGHLGYIDTPAQRNIRPAGVPWCADNGAFSDRFDEVKWWAFLVANAYAAADCLFAVAPDVVGDAVATLDRSLPWLPKIRALGYRAAFVAQNRATSDLIPWDGVDALFLGGSLECLSCDFVWPSDQKPEPRQRCPICGRVLTEWKLGQDARDLAAEGNRRGKWLHMGRVNSDKRFRYAKAIGCDSVDGTYLTRGPDKNLPKLLSWLRHNDQATLFAEVDA